MLAKQIMIVEELPNEIPLNEVETLLKRKGFRPLIFSDHEEFSRYVQKVSSMSQRAQAGDNLALNEKSFELVSGDMRVKFTPTEFLILAPLFNAFNSFLKREDLFDGAEQKSRSLDVHVASIRKKVRAFDLDVETLRGMGYRLSALNSTSTPSPAEKVERT